MLRLLLPVAAIGLMAADTPPGDGAPPVPICVDWAAKPSGDDMAAAITKYAPNFHGGAEIVLGCIVGENLRLSCKALTSTTTDMGMVKAAVAVSANFKMKLKTKDCQAVGTFVKVPLRFSLPS